MDGETPIRHQLRADLMRQLSSNRNTASDRTPISHRTPLSFRTPISYRTLSSRSSILSRGRSVSRPNASPFSPDNDTDLTASPVYHAITDHRMSWLPNLLAQNGSDPRVRLELSEKVIEALQRSRLPTDTKLLNEFCDMICQWLNGSSFKVCLQALEVINTALDISGDIIAVYILERMSTLIERLGDSKQQVREATANLLIDMAAVPTSSPQVVFEKLTSGFNHKQFLIRIYSLKVYRMLLDVSDEVLQPQSIKLLPTLAKLMGDPNMEVRETAFGTMVHVMFCFGEEIQHHLKSQRLLPESKMQVLVQRYEEALRRGSMPSALPRAVRSPRRLEHRAASITATPRTFDVDQENRAGTRAQSVSRTPMYKSRTATGVGSTSRPGTAAGTITEDEIRNSFSQVPRILISSGKDVRDQAESIRAVLENTSNDWSKRVNSLKLIRSTVINGGQDFPEDLIASLTMLEEALCISVKDLRSQVCKEACSTLCFLAENECSSRLGRLWEAILPECIALIPNSAKIMASSGERACEFIVRNIEQPKLIPIVLSGMSSKAAAIRRHTHGLVGEILKTWPQVKLEKVVKTLADAIKTGICDADPGARSNARAAYSQLEQHFPNEAKALFMSLDASKQKTLMGGASATSSSQSVNSLRENLPINRRIGGPGGLPRSSFLQGRSASAIDTNAARLSITPQRTPSSRPMGIRAQMMKSSNTPATTSHRPAVSSPMRRGASVNTVSQPGSRSTSPTRAGTVKKPAVHQMADVRRTPMGTTQQRAGLRQHNGNGMNGDLKTNAHEIMTAIHRLNLSAAADDDDDLCATNPSSRVDADLNQALVQCTSTNPNVATKKEALKKVRDACLRTLPVTDVKRIFDMLMKMVAELNHKLIQSIMDTLTELVRRHSSAMSDHLSLLFQRLFFKIGHEVLPAVQNPLQSTLSVVRETFDPKLQLYAVCKIIQDPIMVQSVKVKMVTLKFLHELLIAMNEAGTAVELNRPEVRSAVNKLFQWMEDQKLKQLSALCESVFVALFNLNIPDVSEMINSFPPSWRDFAHQLLRNNSSASQRSDPANHLISSPTPSHQPGVDHADGRPTHIFSSPGLGPLLNGSGTTSYTAASSSNTHRNVTVSNDMDLSGNIMDFNNLDETLHLAHDISAQNRYIVGLLKVLSDADRHPEKVEEQKTALLTLQKMISEGSFTTWEDNFQGLMLQIFSLLRSKDKGLKKNALRLLTKTCMAQGSRFVEYAEVTMLRVLEAVVEEELGNDPDKAWIVSVADECLKVLAVHLPIHVVLRTLNPVIRSANDPRLSTSLKMLTRLVENVDPDELVDLLDEVVPGVVKCYESPHSPVRKNAVFCLVAMVNKIGKKPLENYLRQLDSKGLKLLDVYVQRAQTSSTTF